MSTVAVPDPKPARMVPLDVLRGLMLVFMAANHIPSDLSVATDHIFGYVSDAEGFVFLSGLLAGLVYTRRMMRSSFAEMRAASFERAGTLYRYHIVVFLAVFAWVWGCVAVTGQPGINSPALMHAHPWSALLAGATFLYQPGLLDILPMYCLFMLAMPFVLRWLESGRGWTVFLASFALWALTNIFLPQHPYVSASGVLNTGAFNIGAWQLLFLTGIVLGHAWARGKVILPPPRAWLIALTLAAAALLYAVRHDYLASPWPDTWLWAMTNKNNLAPLRLVDFALMALLFQLVVTRFPRAVQFHPLAFLGSHSIMVFSAHVVIAIVLLDFPATFSATASGRWLATAILLGGMTLAALAQSWFAAREKARRPPIPTSPTARHARHPA